MVALITLSAGIVAIKTRPRIHFGSMFTAVCMLHVCHPFIGFPTSPLRLRRGTIRSHPCGRASTSWSNRDRSDTISPALPTVCRACWALCHLTSLPLVFLVFAHSFYDLRIDAQCFLTPSRHTKCIFLRNTSYCVKVPAKLVYTRFYIQKAITPIKLLTFFWRPVFPRFVLLLIFSLISSKSGILHF